MVDSTNRADHIPDMAESLELVEGFLMVREGPQGTQYHMNLPNGDSAVLMDSGRKVEKARDRFFNGATIRISIDLGSETFLNPETLINAD